MRAAQFIDHVSDPMLVLDGSVVRAANAPAQQLFGADEATIEGSLLADLFPPLTFDTGEAGTTVRMRLPVADR